MYSGDDETEFKELLTNELHHLASTTAEALETTLFASTELFEDFFYFSLFLDQANGIVKREGLKGEIQIASFHPRYQFSGVEEYDKQNLTNRAPYPIFHLIREDSLQKAIEHHPDTELIYQNNIELMQSLDNEKIKQLFPYLD